MIMNNNAVLRAALQLGGKIGMDKKVTQFHVLFGYSKLLGLGESTLQMMFEEKDYKDLEEARRYFKEKKLDIDLIRQGLPYLAPFLHAEEIPNQDEVLPGEDSQDTPSSYEILCGVINDRDSVLEVFRAGKDMDDVFSMQDRLEKTEKEKRQGEKERREKDEESGEREKSEDREAVKQERSREAADDPAEGLHFVTLDDEDQSDEPTDASTGKEKFQKLAEQFRKLRIDLLASVKGQQDPVMEFVQGLYQAEVLTNADTRRTPKAVFLFVGPPGVGKTFLAENAAENLGLPTRTFNMSEYNSSQSYEGLIGVSPIYNTAQEGRLVEFVRKNPKCILIFDEIEKAHRNTIQIFLQILDLAVADNVYRKEQTDFSEAVIIFTSNACRTIYENTFTGLARTPKNVILDALRHEKDSLTGNPVFPDAICSRIAAGSIIMFNYLASRDLLQIVEENFEKTAEQVMADYGLRMSIDPKLAALFMFHHGSLLDARIASRQSSRFIKNELFEIARQLESHPDLLKEVDTLKLELDADDENMAEEIRDLFTSGKTSEIAVLCREQDRGCFNLPGSCIVHFADTAEELAGLTDLDLEIIVLDPRVGLVFDSQKGVSLDDYDSDGIRAFHMLEDSGNEAPVYLFSAGEALSATDVNTFLRMGAAGILSAEGSTEASIQRQIMQIIEENFMDRKGREFARQGKVLSFNTAQIVNGTDLVIRYHELKKKQALDAESSAAMLLDADRPNVRFDDIIGAENAKEELRYFIRYLSNPRKFIREGGKPAKGLLLYGPPGTGKTMLARAMAGESSFSFIQTSASEFLNKYLGQSEQNVRDLFKRAKRFAPSIIFIDEIDAIGKVRTGEDRHKESVLNALLTEMDGFSVDSKNPVFVMAATNYKVEPGDDGQMTLDPALVRRFDNKIYVDLPTEKERIQYLQLAVSKNGFADIDEEAIHNMAARTPGVSIAVLQNVIDLAFRNAQKEDRKPDSHDLLSALEEYNYGEKREWSEEYYKSVAIHESGHAYVAYLSGEKPSYITIESRGDFGGYMAHENSEGKPVFTKEELRWRIRCALAGRAAEEVFFGKEASLNTGASSDLQAATKYAASMLYEYGMMDDHYVTLSFQKILNTSLAASSLEAINAFLAAEMEETRRLITDGKERVQKLADRLLAENHLTGEKILEALEPAQSSHSIHN